jgi:hypothetical protein
MELDSKFIRAWETDKAFGKPVYEIANKTKGDIIASIGWYPAWKRFVMYPVEGTVWDIGCLQAIAKFIQELK